MKLLGWGRNLWQRAGITSQPRERKVFRGRKEGKEKGNSGGGGI